MRVVLVGSPAERRRLKENLPAGIEIVAEREGMGSADELAADALLVAIAPPWKDDEPLVEPLTSREMQVLERLADGMSNKAIAERLAISDETVKSHLAAIFGKLGARNRTDAIRRALRRGLVPL